MGCYEPDAFGVPRTVHDHFEGRCVVPGADPAFLERVEAYLQGGWSLWGEVRRSQASNMLETGICYPCPVR